MTEPSQETQEKSHSCYRVSQTTPLGRWWDGPGWDTAKHGCSSGPRRRDTCKKFSTTTQDSGSWRIRWRTADGSGRVKSENVEAKCSCDTYEYPISFICMPVCKWKSTPCVLTLITSCILCHMLGRSSSGMETVLHVTLCLRKHKHKLFFATAHIRWGKK